MSKRALIAALLLWGAAGCNRAQRPPQSSRKGPEPQASAAVPAVSPSQPAAAPVASEPGGEANATPPMVGVATAADGFVIPAGSELRVRLLQTLDTKRNHAGDGFRATLDAPIVLDGRVVVPKGTAFHGRVTEAKASGRLKGRAVIGLTLVSFQLHGATYPIATVARVRAGNSHKKRNVAWIGGGSGAGAAAGGIAGGGPGALIGAGAGAAAGATTAFITGRKNLKLPVETPLTFALRTGVAVKG